MSTTSWRRPEADAVVHLGVGRRGQGLDPRTYGDNVRGTYNLFQACADMGIKRIVSASSAQVYGFASAARLRAGGRGPSAAPGEQLRLSKMAGEQAADYFVHNFGLTILSFRFMGVRPVPRLAPEIEQMARDPAWGSWLLWSAHRCA
ncbi:MAG: NAD-dependent epimerase/dehydratase family protein [Caldilineaceae bacterium]